MNIRKYREGDEYGIVELLNAAFWYRQSLETWRWRYKKNPAGSPIIWVAEHNNKIIGHYAIVPIVMKVGNIYITGSFGRNAATHPKYQGMGVFSSIVNKCYPDAAENGIPLTYGFANPNLVPYRKYERKGHICFMTDMVRVLNWKPLLDKYVHNEFLARAGGRLLGKSRRHRSADGCWKIESVSRFDERIDRFWEEISECFKIIVKRDQRYLNWRYLDHPENRYTAYAAVKDHRILGYCVLHERVYQNLRLGVIDDLLGFQGHNNVVGYIIQSAIEFFKNRDVDVVICTEMPEKHPYITILCKAGFVPYPRRRAAALVCTLNLRGSSISDEGAYSQALILSQNPFLREKRNWFMMHGDRGG